MGKNGFNLGFIDNSVSGGTHIAVLFEKKEDLLEIFPSYFAQGIKDNEQCIFVYCKDSFRDEMEKAISGFADIGAAKVSGQLMLSHYKDIYFEKEALKTDRVMLTIDEKLDGLKYRSLTGIRTLGVMSWVGADDFKKMMEYEKELTRFCHGKDVVVACAYPSKEIPPNMLIDIIVSHTHIVYKSEGKWKISIPVERQMMTAKIEGLEQFTKLAVERELKMTELKEKIKQLESEKTTQ